MPTNCVRLLPAEAVTVRLPPTSEVPSTVARLLVRLASPLAPLVLSDNAPGQLVAYQCDGRVHQAEVIEQDAPVTVNTVAPDCVRLPTVSVTVRVPPTVRGPSTVAMPLVSCASPAAPLAVSERPSEQVGVIQHVMVAFAVEVVNAECRRPSMRRSG